MSHSLDNEYCIVKPAEADKFQFLLILLEANVNGCTKEYMPIPDLPLFGGRTVGPKAFAANLFPIFVARCEKSQKL